MATFEQNQVSKVTWRWTHSDEQATAKPESKKHDKKVFISTPIALGIAYCVHRYSSHPKMAFVIAGIALFIAFSAFVLPTVYEAIDGFFQTFARWVGTGMTWILLVPFFFLFFVPGRILFKLSGKDSLRLNFLPKEDSYWIPHPGVTREDHYRKQH